MFPQNKQFCGNIPDVDGCSSADAVLKSWGLLLTVLVSSEGVDEAVDEHAVKFL